MSFQFRQARLEDVGNIWDILQYAIAMRKADGSDQWQDGYPNPDIVRRDIENGYGFVLAEGDSIAGYCAILINDEPAYADIKGKWLTDGDFIVYHRVAVSRDHLGKGVAQILLSNIETYAMDQHIYSLKADTNFDNARMLKIFEKMGYVYCGEVSFRGSPRKAFEKVLEV